KSKFQDNYINKSNRHQPGHSDDNSRLYFVFFFSHQSSTLFMRRVGIGDTISGNFSTTTFEGSNPKPLSSERLISFNHKWSFIIIRSQKGSSLSWLKYFSITMNWKSPTAVLVVR